MSHVLGGGLWISHERGQNPHPLSQKARKKGGAPRFFFLGTIPGEGGPLYFAVVGDGYRSRAFAGDCGQERYFDEAACAGRQACAAGCRDKGEIGGVGAADWIVPGKQRLNHPDTLRLSERAVFIHCPRL